MGRRIMRKQTKDTIVIGAALFAMFFGAGNLIFPPAIGLKAGDAWIMSLLGFVMTGIGLPVLGIIAVSKAGGSIKDLSKKVNPLFATVLATVIILAIGPLLAIPRTGATVYEIGIEPIFGTVNPFIVSIIYFAITLFFVIKPSGIIDKIGKILTPILLLVTLTIIIKGIFFPIGSPIQTSIKIPFSNGFTDGYQTMDTLGSVVMASIVLLALIEKGYTNKKQQLKLASKAGIIAGMGLLIIYGGLLYLGATSSALYGPDIEKSTLIINITNAVLGNLGQIGMCIVVSAACLTTSIGLTAVVGNYFVDLSKGKLKYQWIVIFTCAFSSIMSVIGIEKLVMVAVPLLTLVYPVTIVLIVLGLLDGWIKNKTIYKGAVLGTLIVSTIDALKIMAIAPTALDNLVSLLPFSEAGFSWILPAIAFAYLFSFIKDKDLEIIDSHMNSLEKAS